MSYAIPSRTGYILSISAGLIWATTGILIKHLLDRYGMSALALAFWRDAFIALACLIGLLAVCPGLLRIRKRELRDFAIMGAISIGLYHALWVTSIELNGAAVAIVLVFTFPTFVAIGARL